MIIITYLIFIIAYNINISIMKVPSRSIVQISFIFKISLLKISNIADEKVNFKS